MPAGLNAQGSGIPMSDAMGKYKVNGIQCVCRASLSLEAQSMFVFSFKFD